MSFAPYRILLSFWILYSFQDNFFLPASLTLSSLFLSFQHPFLLPAPRFPSSSSHSLCFLHSFQWTSLLASFSSLSIPLYIQHPSVILSPISTLIISPLFLYPTLFLSPFTPSSILQPSSIFISFYYRVAFPVFFYPSLFPASLSLSNTQCSSQHSSLLPLSLFKFSPDLALPEPHWG